MAAEDLLLDVHDDDGRYTLALRHRPDRVVELREAAEPAGGSRRRFDVRLRVPAGSLPALMAYLVPRLPPAAPAGAYPRLVAALRAEVEAGELSPQRPGRNWQHLLRWCQQAGAAFATVSVDPDGCEHHRRREVPLARWTGPGRRVGTLWLRFDTSVPAGTPGGVELAERYDVPGARTGYFEYGLALPSAAMPALAQVLAARHDTVVSGAGEDDIVAHLAALVEHGDLGAGLPVRANRERLLTWCVPAGIAHERRGWDRWETLAEERLVHAGEVCTLTVSFGAKGTRPSLAFLEAYQPPGDVDGRYVFQAEAPYEDLPALAGHLADRAGLPAAGRTDDPEDLLVAALAALVARGELAPGLPRRLNRDRAAGWFTEAGAQCQVYGDTRRHRLLKVYRQRTDCIFRLCAALTPTEELRGVSFTECYDYLPQAGDSGREYSYTVVAPYAELGRLVEFLEGRFGRAGDVAANRDPVLGWFAEAGADPQPDDWSWTDSD